RVTLQNNDIANVTLRVPAHTAPAADAGGSTVSVAQMKVPQKARDLLRKAQKAMDKNNVQESWTLTQKALDLYPDFAEALTLRALLNLGEKKFTDAVPDLE